MTDNPYEALLTPELKSESPPEKHTVRPSYITLLAAPVCAIVGALVGFAAFSTSGDLMLAVVVSVACTWLTIVAVMLWQEHRHRPLTPLFIRAIGAELLMGMLFAAPFALGVAAFGAWASYFPLAAEDGKVSTPAVLTTGFLANFVLSAAAVATCQLWRRRRRF